MGLREGACRGPARTGVPQVLLLPLPATAQGMDVVEALAGLPRVADNTGSPYFQAGKALGAWGYYVGLVSRPGAGLGGRQRWDAAWRCTGVLQTRSAAATAATAGDKRADVAQRAFNKPFSKIVVVECGFVYP